MFNKAALLLLLVAVAVQSYIPHDVKRQADGDADSLIQDLSKLIDQASETAKGALNNLHTYLVVRFSQTEEKYRSKIFAQITDLTDEIEKLQTEAKKLKVDVKECIRDDEMIYVVKLHRAIEACTNDVVNKPKTLAVDVKKVEAESAEYIKKIAAELEACGNDAKCKNKVVVEIARAMTELPAKIRETVDEPMAAILSAYPAAEQCVMEAVDVFIPEERQIATVTVSCMKNKIHPPKDD